MRLGKEWMKCKKLKKAESPLLDCHCFLVKVSCIFRPRKIKIELGKLVSTILTHSNKVLWSSDLRLQNKPYQKEAKKPQTLMEGTQNLETLSRVLQWISVTALGSLVHIPPNRVRRFQWQVFPVPKRHLSSPTKTISWEKRNKQSLNLKKDRQDSTRRFSSPNKAIRF